MILLLCLVIMKFDVILCPLLYYDEDDTTSSPNINDFEPILPPMNEYIESVKRIDCESYAAYASNCTKTSALMYSDTENVPPMPGKMSDWCRAIRHLTNCAVDWNSECKDVTESHFNEERIKGHVHVVNSICDDEWFLLQYEKLPECINIAASAWEQCYSSFKSTVTKQKNTTKEWTHYDVHFQLCCARTQFRRCTLDTLFTQQESKCEQEQAVTLQKFSVIVSEGEVIQDCERNVMYENCPGGDPRPPTAVLARLMNVDSVKHNIAAVACKGNIICMCLLFLLYWSFCL